MKTEEVRCCNKNEFAGKIIQSIYEQFRHCFRTITTPSTTDGDFSQCFRRCFQHNHFYYVGSFFASDLIRIVLGGRNGRKYSTGTPSNNGNALGSRRGEGGTTQCWVEEHSQEHDKCEPSYSSSFAATQRRGVRKIVLVHFIS